MAKVAVKAKKRTKPAKGKKPRRGVLDLPKAVTTRMAEGRTERESVPLEAHGEWLARVAWFGTAAVTGLAVWGAVAAPPEAVAWLTPRARVLWYTIVVPSVAAVALALLGLGLVLRRPGPWTQPLYLALLLFPAPFAVGVLVFGEVAA